MESGVRNRKAGILSFLFLGLRADTDSNGKEKEQAGCGGRENSGNT
jgi:hypothetical protein